MLIVIKGRCPSKKNSKQIICRGRYPQVLPSKAHKEWHTDATLQLYHQNAPKNKIKKFDLHVWFYAPDKRRADASNKLESVNDLLVDYGVIEDDSWFHIQEMCIHAVEVDKENPRVEIEITEV